MLSFVSKKKNFNTAGIFILRLVMLSLFSILENKEDYRNTEKACAALSNKKLLPVYTCEIKIQVKSIVLTSMQRF